MSRRRPRSKYNQRGYSQRRIDVREVRERFLIVCEDARTEPAYFKSFRVPKIVVEVHGYGYNTIALVEKAIELKQQEAYDQIWCVLDRNSFNPAHDNPSTKVHLLVEQLNRFLV